jgi:hypothetical protein
MTGRELIELLEELDEDVLDLQVVFSEEPLKFRKIKDANETTVGSNSYLVLR